MLLHNGNKFPSAPITHAANMTESYENTKLLLEKIPYEKYNWNICEDIRSLLSCLVCSLVKQSFVALCASGTVGTESIITLKNWPQRESLIPGQKIVVNTPIINPKKVYLPPSHTKLGLIKNPVKAVGSKIALDLCN